MSGEEEYKNLDVQVEHGRAWVAIDRPAMKNALDGETLASLARAFKSFEAGGEAKVVFLLGKNGIFSAGADLAWMKRGRSREDFLRSSRLLAEALLAVSRCPLPTVALAEQAAMGGAMGLLAACDFVLAEEGTRLRTPELRLGLVPAVVGPYLLRRLGDRACRSLFLRAEMIVAEDARTLGLVDHITPRGEIVSSAKAFAQPLTEAGPSALAACKEMLRRLPGLDPDAQTHYTVELIADLRAGREGQEGMAAFLEKRKPGWRAGGGA